MRGRLRDFWREQRDKEAIDIDNSSAGVLETPTTVDSSFLERFKAEYDTEPTDTTLSDASTPTEKNFIKRAINFTNKAFTSVKEAHGNVVQLRGQAREKIAAFAANADDMFSDLAEKIDALDGLTDESISESHVLFVAQKVEEERRLERQQECELKAALEEQQGDRVVSSLEHVSDYFYATLML